MLGYEPYFATYWLYVRGALYLMCYCEISDKAWYEEMQARYA